MERIAIYVQHLLGAGHLVRAMSLAESFASSGHDVLLLSGGFHIERPVIGYNFFQLPPTKAIEGDFSKLVTSNGDLVNTAWRENRATVLLEKIKSFNPAVVITETFPFGRRKFRFELIPLIEWVNSQSSVHLLASIRDILQRRSDRKNRITVDLIKQYYDGVLVHADKQLFQLDASFELSHEISNKLIYTGYIHEPINNEIPFGEESDGYGEILVSGGSGTVSAKLIQTARRAKPLSAENKRTWRLLTGRSFDKVKPDSKPGLILETNRPDFHLLLSRCALSVSQAGYNTSLDILTSKAKSVMVPYSANGETEQSDRARALEKVGRLIQIPESELTPSNLAKAIDRAMEMAVKQVTINVDGASTSAKLINGLLKQWRQRANV